MLEGCGGRPGSEEENEERSQRCPCALHTQGVASHNAPESQNQRCPCALYTQGVASHNALEFQNASRHPYHSKRECKIIVSHLYVVFAGEIHKYICSPIRMHRSERERERDCRVIPLSTTHFHKPIGYNQGSISNILAKIMCGTGS